MSIHLVVIGNGFDLDCGLPTRYSDFLDFLALVRKLYKVDRGERTAAIGGWCDRLRNAGVRAEMESLLIKAFCGSDDAPLKEWIDSTRQNCWIDYFEKARVGAGWVDFEGEIARLVRKVEDVMYLDPSGIHELGDAIVLTGKAAAVCKELQPLFEGVPGFEIRESTSNGKSATYFRGITYRELRDRMLTDLHGVVLAFESYLHDFIERIGVDVLKATMTDGVRSLLDGLAADGDRYVLSFNYTHTFERLFAKLHADKAGSTTYCYIHGEAKESFGSMEKCSMVLGIDEYREGEDRNRNLDFIEFRKYYQRIVKGNDGSYVAWQEVFAKRALSKAMSIYGHSLAVTDGEVLRPFLLADGVMTLCHYHNKDALGQCVTNLVAVIGADNLVRLTGNLPRSLRFAPQV